MKKMISVKNSLRFFILIGVFSFVVSCESKEKELMNPGVTIQNVEVVNEKDPVCEMLTAEHLKDTLTYQGKLYGFCSTNCKEEFKTNPKNFTREK